MFASLQKKYFLSDKGIAGVKRGIFWTTITNIIIMGGMAFLFLLMDAFMQHLTTGAALPEILPFACSLALFAVALFASNWQQYNNTYCVFYEECGNQRIEISEHLRKLPLGFFGKRDLADLTETIMSDVQVMEHAYSHVLGEFWGAIISTAVVFIGSLFYCWPLAIASFWSVPIAFILLFATRKPMSRAFDKHRFAKLQVTEQIQETLECIREIRATNQETHYLTGLSKTIDTAEKKSASCELANGLIVNSAFVILRLGIATTLITGASMVASGQIDFMMMFAFLLMVSRIYAPFDQAIMLMSEFFAAESSAKRMRAIMEEPLAEGSSTFDPKGHDVAFENVAFKYNSAENGEDEQVLSNVSFVAHEGEVTALVGPSGSGKSTCARLAARFYDANSGKVTVGGVDVSTVDPEILLQDYAIVFQDVLLFDNTVMENIRLGRKNATDEEVLAAAHAANCDEFVSRMPEGYSTMIGENGSKLSGGERQRISIARALLKDAPIVLLDEATASLDVENESKVQVALSRLLAGKTVIVIAHRMRTVENADKIVVLKDGVVAEQGSPAELKASNGIFSHMVNLQKSSATWALS